jgi:glycosyltransferase involved in cell wall biosynthesis
VITLLEPPRPTGFVSGGYRYQHEIGERLVAAGLGELRVVAADQLDAAIDELRAEPDRTIVVDGLFTELAHGAPPPGVIVLLHNVPAHREWLQGARIIATAATTAIALRGVAADVTVVRPGLDACFVHRNAPEPRTGPARVVQVGTVCPGKGQLLVVRALRSAARPCELSLLGDDGSHPDYAAEVRAAAGQLRVHWRGCVSPTEVARALHEADLFVSASRRESFGMAVAEAAACGVPLLAFATGEVTSHVQDGYNGWLVDSDAADARFAARVASVVGDPGALARARERWRRPELGTWDEAAAAFRAACAERS